MEPFDCIDASIILGLLFEEHEGCKHYMNNVGYKHKNKGKLTIPLIGEIFTNMLLKLPEKIPDSLQRRVFIQSAVDFFDQTVMGFIRSKRLQIVPMSSVDQQHMGKIKEIDYKITDDDAIHLSTAISKECQRFITIDEYLLTENCQAKIKKEFGLIIAEPMRI